MTTRRQILAAAASGLLLRPLASLAQKAPVPKRIGLLGSRKRPEPLEIDPYGGVPKGLRDLGYVEGRDFVMEWRFAAGDYAKLPILAEELVQFPVDVIVVDGTPGTRAAQAATKTIPIVFVGGADVVTDGLVHSLAHPGGNTTGFSLLLTDTVGKQLEFLGAWVPQLSRLAVLFNPSNPASTGPLNKVIEIADARNVQVTRLGVHTAAEIEKAFSTAAQDACQALLWLVDSFLFQQGRQTAELSAKNRIASISGYPEYADQGGLMGYGPNRRTLYRRAAEYVDRIFKGAKPGDLPVQQPSKLDLVINRKTAKALGLKIPPELLVLADKVIE